MNMRENKLSWDNVTVQQYIDIQNAIYNSSTENSIEQIGRIIEILLHIDINTINIVEANKIIEDVSKFLSTPMTAKTEFKKLKVGETKCYIVDLTSMTLQQFMTYQELTKDPNANLLELLVLSIVPDKAKYNDGTYDIDEFREEVKNLPITYVYGVVNFQLAKLKSQFRFSLAYLTVQVWLSRGTEKEMKKQMKKALQMVYKSMVF